MDYKLSRGCGKRRLPLSLDYTRLRIAITMEFRQQYLRIAITLVTLITSVLVGLLVIALALLITLLLFPA